MSLQLRVFRPEDKIRVIAIFRSNMPQFFDPSELEPFQQFLDDIKGDYFVCLKEDTIIGSGGFYETEEGEARICWLMIDHSSHSKGIGRFMMEEFRTKVISNGNSNRITLKTTQYTDKFYEKLGYHTTYFEEDFWVKGLHLYFMERSIA